jgi:hypothetical protein
MTGHKRDDRHTMRSDNGGSTFLTPDLANSIIADISSRKVFDSEIAIANGISPKTLHTWLKRGLEENAREPYKTFAERYVKEHIEEEGRALEMVYLAAKKDWKAAAWYLEKKYPKRYGNLVPASGPAGAVDFNQILEENDNQKQSLIDLLKDPPPQLLAALKEAAPQLKQLLELPEDE